MTGYKPIKVLYVSGYQRSGTTLVAKVLGELPETCAVGELRLMWFRSFIKNQPCGCGRRFHDCPFWRQVITDAYGDFEAADPQWMIDHQEHSRHLPLMLLPGRDRYFSSRYAEYLAALDKLYRSVSEQTDSRIIIDSSKWPTYGYMLSLVPSLDVYVLHITRDPHGVQHSMLKRKAQGHRGYQKHSVVRKSLVWDMMNVSHELMGARNHDRYMRLRYEDFISDPESVLRQITRFMQEPDLEIPRVTDGAVEFHAAHTVLGGKTIFDVGPVKLRLDRAWIEQMDEVTRAKVTFMTYPLLKRYGYTQPSVEANARGS